MSSVAVAAILAAYLGNQITGALILPLALGSSINVVLYCSLVGVLVPAAVLVLSSVLFRRKNL